MSKVKTLTAEISALIKAGDADFLMLAAKLQRLQQALADMEGPKSRRTFEDAIRKIGLSRRKAFYLLKIHEAVSHLKISYSQLHSLGWTKLSLLADHFDRENAQNLIELARNNPVSALRQSLSNVKPTLRSMTFRLTNDQYDLVSRVMLQHGAVKKDETLTDKEFALARMASLLDDLKTKT